MAGTRRDKWALLTKATRKYFENAQDIPSLVDHPHLVSGETLKSINNAGTGLVDIVKSNVSDVLQFPTAAQFDSTVAITGALTVGGKIVPQTFFIPFVVAAGAAAADYDGVIPIPVACKIVSITERHQTAGNDAGAVTLMPKKVPSGTAKASGTDLLAAGLNLKATADTNQTGTLHATAANYTFAAGDGIANVLTGTPTAVDGVALLYEFQRV